MHDRNTSPLSEEQVNLLETRTQEALFLSTSEVFELVDKLEAVRKLLDSKKLYVQRFSGLKRSTNKEKVIDCHYLRKCLMFWIEEPQMLTELEATLDAARTALSLREKQPDQEAP